MLSKQTVGRFKEIMKKEYGQELSMAEAEEQGTRLLNFFELLINIDQKHKI